MSAFQAWSGSPHGLRGRGLRSHLLTFAFVLLLPLAAFSTWAVAEAVEGQRRATRAHLEDTARAIALLLDSELDTRLAALRALASSPLVDEIGGDCRFHDWAAEVGRANGSWVVVSGPRMPGGYPQRINTLLPCGADAPVGGPDEALERAFRTGKPAVANLFRGHLSDRLLSAVVVPVVRDGTVTAAISIPFEPAQISDMLRGFAAGHGLTLSVVDAARAVVARSASAEALLGARVPPGTVASGGGRQSGFVIGTSSDGAELAMAFHRLSSAPGWTAIVGMPADVYEDAWTGPAGRLLAGGIAALLAAVILGTTGARRLLRPIRHLTATAFAMRAGRNGSWTTPEPAGVAEFDRLAEALAEGSAALQRRVAEQQQALDALAREERRYRALARAGTLIAWRAEPGGAILEGHGWDELTGQPGDRLRGDGWLDALHPDDREGTARAWAEARAAERPVDVEYRVRNPGAEGEWRWVRARGVPVRSRPDGPIEEWVGVIEDAHERRSQEERQALLAREVDHRAKNALAVVQAAVRLTRAADMPSYVRSVEGRVTALARAHTLLAQDRWRGADLRSLLAGELVPFLSEGNGPRAVLEGPPVALPALAAQPLGMAFHELATNAVKHGALSTAEGRVAIAWRIDAGGGRTMLRLRWTETGGPPLGSEPARRGFGSRVLTGTLRDQLGGKVSLDWRQEGLVCEMEVPLARRGDHRSDGRSPATPAARRGDPQERRGEQGRGEGRGQGDRQPVASAFHGLPS